MKVRFFCTPSESLWNVPTNICAEFDGCTPKCPKKQSLSHSTIRVTQNRELSSVSYHDELFTGELPKHGMLKFDMQNLENSLSFDKQNLQNSRFDIKNLEISRLDMQNLEISRFDSHAES